MTLETYIENLKQFAKENPKALKMQAIYAKDNEGNGHSPIYFTPTKALYEYGYADDDVTNETFNSVIIN